MHDSHLRTVRFCPYRRGMGPTFTLTMRDSGKVDSRGVTRIAYRLTMREPGAKRGVVVFDGADYSGSPMHADDSDENVHGLMGFLTLRPGDTDAEYFISYTPDQLAYAINHGEALSCEVDNRYACPECGAALGSDRECHWHGRIPRR